MHDIRLAEAVLVSGGIVMVDDITNAAWPGVIEGVARYLLDPTRRLFPFMMSHNKLWFTTGDCQRDYLAFAMQHVLVTRSGQQKRKADFFGSEIAAW